ncbi:WYL domain-containing protein [Cellulosimicrobium funkei]|nr:WYL domain-containing protein [Cellulosimicrobium funkei]
MSAASPARSTERIVSLLWVLLASGRRGVTREYLITSVDAYALSPSAAAFEKMFTRDKEVLKGIGVPLESFTVQDESGFESSDPGGETRYRIDEDRMYLPAIPFTNGERLALMRAESAWAGSETGHAVVRALGRVDSGEDWYQARSGSDHEAFGVRLAGADRYLTELGDMVRDQSVVRFTYRTVNAERAEDRTVRAWALTNPTGVWYLVGWDLDRQEQRTFRLTRFESAPRVVEVGSDRAPRRPVDFDVQAVHDVVSGQRQSASTVLHLATGRAVHLRIGAEPTDRSATAPEGWDEVRVTYTRPAELAGSIAAAGPLARVPDVEDPLRAAVVTLLEGALAAHAAVRPDYTLSMPKRRRNRRTDRDKVAAVVDAIGLANQRGGISRAELADRLHVGDRELTAILDELWFCGMPERQFAGQQFEVLEQDGRIRITQAERLSGPLRLSVPEAAALAIGLRAAAGIPGLTDTERQDTASALDKILAASGPEVEQAATGIVAGFDFGPFNELAGRLHAAVREQTLLSIDYHSATRDATSTRTVEPLRITSEGGHGYLQAWCRSSDGRRNFRLDRIAAVRETGETFDPRYLPLDDRLFTQHGDEVAVTIHFAHRIRDLAAGFDPERTAVLEDGSVVAEVRLAHADYAHAQAARFGGEFRVLAPHELVESTVDWLQLARSGYVTGNSPSPSVSTGTGPAA